MRGREENTSMTGVIVMIEDAISSCYYYCYCGYKNMPMK